MNFGVFDMYVHVL